MTIIHSQNILLISKDIKKYKRIVAILIATGLLLGSLFGSIYYFHTNTENEIKQTVLDNEIKLQQESTKHISSRISSDLALMLELMEDVATSNNLIKGDFTSEETLHLISDLFHELDMKSENFGILIIDKDGIISSAVGGNNSTITNYIGRDISFRDYLIDTKSSLSPVFSNGIVGLDGHDRIVVTYPIISENDEYRGTLLSGINAPSFFTHYENIVDIESKSMIVLGKNQKIIVNPYHPTLNGNTYGETFYDTNNKYDFDLLLQNLFKGESFEIVYDFQNVERIGTAEPVSVNGENVYYVFLTTPTSIIYSQIDDILAKQNLQIIILFVILTIAVGFVIFFFERYKIREENEKTIKLSTIGELSARLAHDLRNPLHVIRISNEILKTMNPEYSESSLKQFKMQDRAITRMTHQIDGVMDFVRQKPIMLVNSSLFDLLHNTIDNMNIPKHIKITYPEHDLTINCDPNQIETVFSNLILNGIQAINEEGQIDITASDFNGAITIVFTDSGLGISPKVLQKIFEPLFTTKQHGTGLGLAGCKTIIENHGGSIRVNNNPTSFKITLPKPTKNDKTRL